VCLLSCVHCCLPVVCAFFRSSCVRLTSSQSSSVVECFPEERRHVHDLRGKVDLTLVLSCATRKEATHEFQVGMASTDTKLERRGGSDRWRASSVEFSHSNFLRHSHFRASYSIHTALFRTAPQGSAHQTTLITTAWSVPCEGCSPPLPKPQQEYRLRSVFLDCQTGSQTGSADRNTRKHQQHTTSARINVYPSCELLGRVVEVFPFI
jgi:hypothetical protein